MKKHILLDVIFIIVMAALLFIINESGKTQALTPYAFIFLYGSYLLGRLSAGVAKRSY